MTLQQIIEEAVKEFDEKIGVTSDKQEFPPFIPETYQELHYLLIVAITKSVERVLEEVKIPEKEICLCDPCNRCGRNYGVACFRQQQKFNSLMRKV